MRDEVRYAHRTKNSDFENFYNIMYGVREIKTKKEEQDFEACYFAMCLLLPKESFLQTIEILGGMDMVMRDFTRRQSLARFFNVEPRLVKVRMWDLLSQEEQKQQEQTAIKKIKTYNNKG